MNSIKKLSALLLALLFVFTLLPSAFAANDAVYSTLDEIVESGPINIGVFSDKNPFG